MGTRGWFSYKELELEVLEVLTRLSSPTYPQGDSDRPPGLSEVNEPGPFANIRYFVTEGYGLVPPPQYPRALPLHSRSDRYPQNGYRRNGYRSYDRYYPDRRDNHSGPAGALEWVPARSGRVLALVGAGYWSVPGGNPRASGD
jgi:hypothetical protein